MYSCIGLNVITVSQLTGPVKHKRASTQDPAVPSAPAPAPDAAAKRKRSIDPQDDAVATKKKKKQIKNEKQTSLESATKVKTDDEAVKTVRTCCSQQYSDLFTRLYCLASPKTNNKVHETRH